MKVAPVWDAATQWPVTFTQNIGQWPDSILFRAEAGSAVLWLTQSGACYELRRTLERPSSTGGDLLCSHAESITETDLIRVVYSGASRQSRVLGEGLLDGRSNYFIGNDPQCWRTDVPMYRAVLVEDLYPGIDLLYYGQGAKLEYDFIAAPGADLAQIQIRYEGVRSVEVTGGELVVRTVWADFSERIPYAYQVVDGERRPLTVVYAATEEGVFGFDVRGHVSPEFAVVIDPTLVFSSYLGGSAGDLAHAVDIDALGNIYVAGVTSSTNFPTQDPYQTDQGADDAFVLKLSADGQTLIYATYLGGNQADEAFGLAVDNKDNAYVTGVTESTNFPTVQALQGDQGFPDAFVARLSSDGNSLVYSTYLGGSSFDEAHAIAVDAQGHAYVAGVTSSSNFPTKNPYQSDQAGDDGFVVKLAPTGDTLRYGTYLGGNHIDQIAALALDGGGSVYATGQTRSSDLATAGAYQTYQGDWDAYVTKLNTSGTGLVYSTYLGGTAGDYGQGIAVDGSGQAYVTGVTSSSDFPTNAPFQSDMLSDDAFLVKLNADGDAAVYATYLGGDSPDFGRRVAVNAGGHACVAGWTLSTNFPTMNPIQTANDTVDAFVAMFSADGSALDFATYFSGTGVDDARGLAVSAGGDIYVAGRTDSPNFLTLNPYQTDQGGRDGFVLMLEGNTVGIREEEAKPDDIGPVSNYPNPFNAGTVVSFTLATPQVVKLTIYNVLGEQVSVLCDHVLPAGRHEIQWDGRDFGGRWLPSGTYLYRLKTLESMREGKMTLAK